MKLIFGALFAVRDETEEAGEAEDRKAMVGARIVKRGISQSRQLGATSDP